MQGAVFLQTARQSVKIRHGHRYYILMEKGLIHIYTGEGKGKTTSAVGHCVRAKSRGLRVLFAQFMKRIEGGETSLLEKLSIRTMRFESVLSPHFNPEADAERNRKETLKALDALKDVMKDYDLMVLDEFNCLLKNGLITGDEALGFLKGKPEGLEVILTGRGATDRLMDFADLVTYMKAIKHPSTKGVPARMGIEY